MSFRTRLIGFFVLIVVVPMIAVGFLVFRLIGDSQQGKANARASGLASAAASLYASEAASGRLDAATIARGLSRQQSTNIRSLAIRSGLARLVVRRGDRTLADVGARTAIAPGMARVAAPVGHGGLSVSASELTAAQYARQLAGSGVEIVVREGSMTLGSTLPTAPSHLPRQANLSIDGTSYRAVTQTFQGFGSSPVSVTVLSDLAATNSSVQTSQIVAAAFIAAFLLLALGFSVLAARELQSQLARFLQAARRLGSGDFTSPVPIEGNDEFAALGEEFNKMSGQLEHRLGELQQERARLRESIGRIGKTFASNLDRPVLLEVAFRTAVDAVQADCARLSARSTPREPLAQTELVGSLAGIEQQVLEAEWKALRSGGLGESRVDGTCFASVALGAFEDSDRISGLITVGRRQPFTDHDRDILRSLAGQTTLALENVELHYQVRRKAVTDELTGLANHGRFQELLQLEMEQVRRYRHPVGLIMLDVDDFKSVNDTYGHQQGDIVLRQVARVLRDTSREADSPARYGGEEMAVILPHTDLEGAYTIAERIRSSVEALRVPRLDRNGILRITASLGVAASNSGRKDTLIAEADAALYRAKRQGKNRTVEATPQPANVTGGK
jgi:diguanylate cyclase (GGDEF)-like protein